MDDRVKLGDPLAQRRNALNFVRLVLASSVVIGHTFPLGGFGASRLEGLADLAVNGFFAISGYLIAGSRVRLTMRQFLWNRVLRIMPAFWVCLVVVAFVIAPLSTFLDGSSWDLASAWGFVSLNALLYMRQWGVMETLQSVPFPNAWNGSLWTLFYEFVAYLMAGAALSFRFARQHPAPVLGILTVAAALSNQLLEPLEVGLRIFHNGARLGGFFAAGMLMWALRDRLPASKPLSAISGVLVVTCFFLPDVWNWSLTPIPLAYLMLYLGGALPTALGSQHDISYGVYIYAFPVQQLLALSFGPSLGVVGMALAALLLTVPLAWASWLFIERPALRLKNASSWLSGPRSRTTTAGAP